MLLEKVAHYNDLSVGLREKLEERVKSFGKRVRYKFDISNQNPDPAKYNGAIIWPIQYTLDPTVFSINDPYVAKGETRSKRIAIIDGVDEKGLPNKFKKIRIEGKYKGILELEIEDNNEHLHYAMFLELHPKNKNGMFPDNTKHLVFSRIDEHALATEQRTLRTSKLKALNAAGDMSDKEVVDFADAMMWDSTEEIDLIRNKVEELAETTPDMFNDLIAGKNIEFQAAVKQALDRKIISFDPVDWRFTWSSNQQVITVLSPSDDKTHVEKLAEWFQVGGVKADETYKKIKALIK